MELAQGGNTPEKSLAAERSELVAHLRETYGGTKETFMRACTAVVSDIENGGDTFDAYDSVKRVAEYSPNRLSEADISWFTEFAHALATHRDTAAAVHKRYEGDVDEFLSDIREPFGIGKDVQPKKGVRIGHSAFCLTLTFESEEDMNNFKPANTYTNTACNAYYAYGLSFKGKEFAVVGLPKRSSAEMAELLAHEQQHIVNAIMGLESAADIAGWRSALMEAQEKGADEATVLALSRRFLTSYRSLKDHKVADELTAKIHNTNLDTNADRLVWDIYNNYQYFEKRPLDTEEGTRDRALSELREVLEDKYHSHIPSLEWQVFEEDYVALLRSSITSMHRLLQRGYRNEEVSHLLLNVPLSQWNKVSQRLAERRSFPWTVMKFSPGDTLIILKDGVPTPTVVDSLPYKSKYARVAGEVFVRKEDGSVEAHTITSTDTLTTYPFKKPDAWLSIWESLGGPPGASEVLGGLDSNSTYSALDIWTRLRPLYMESVKEGTNTRALRDLFWEYRKILRKKF